MAANGRAAGRTSAGDHTDSTSPLLSHSSPTTPVNEAGDDSLENRLTRSEGVSMPLFASAEAREQMAASPVRSPGSVRRYGSVNHHEYGMNPLALWHTEGNHVMSESGRRGSRRRSSNTLDEEFSIVSEEFLRSEETSEVGNWWRWRGWVQCCREIWHCGKSVAVNERVDAKLLDTQLDALPVTHYLCCNRLSML